MSGRPDITGHGRPTVAPLVPTERIVIREVADGAGPSHLLPIGEHLLVIDPWDAAIRRYTPADIAAPPLVAAMPRGFAPWRSRRIGGGVELLAEPYGPEDDGSYRLRSHTVMTITPAAIAALQPGAACGFPIHAVDAWVGDGHRVSDEPGAAARFRLDRNAFATLMPIGGAAAQIPAVRHAGTLRQGRSLVWWSEVEGPDLRDEGRGYGGRVTAAHYVGIVPAGGGAPDAVIRIRSAAYAPLVPGAPPPAATLLVKPGFEYVAGTTDGERDMLWVMAADSDPATPCFVLLGYPLDGLARGDRAVVSLVAGGSEEIDRNDPPDPPDAMLPWDKAPPRTGPRSRWFAAVEQRLREQIACRWQYPEGAYDRPCGGADRGPVGADATGALGTGERFPHPVADKIDTSGGAEWMRPRQLIGTAAGDRLAGVPYSIGGFDLADDFAARLAEGYDGNTRDPPPIGHIREGLEWPGQGRHYPLGIDCSALVARIFGVGVRSTAEMVAGTDFVAADGSIYRLPRGPDGSCVEPVRHLRDALPGDLLLRDGHIVIYAGTITVDAGLALRVYEASARTGRVCESVYDPTFFDGWWILRMCLEGEADCPRWIDDGGAR